MEAYPRDFLNCLVPLMVVSGLEPDNSGPDSPDNGWYQSVVESHPLSLQGELLASHGVPIATTELAIDLRSRLAAKSRALTQWEDQALKVSRKEVNHLLHIQFSDTKKFRLPPTKRVIYASDAPPPPVSQGPRLDFTKKYDNGDSHSAISPRNSKSQLFPDGVLGVEWIQKYLYLLPSTLLSVHQLGPGIAADDELARVLNELKIQVQNRGIKLVVVLLVEGEVNDAINDRIYNVRRNTGLAARTGLFVLPDKSQSVERETLAETICQLAYVQAQEFAMTISKDLRRKRGQNNVLSSSEAEKLTIPPLPNVGWELRYNFKLAAMAEFRQELEVALTLYETAYDSMLELFETLKVGGGNSSAHDRERWCQGRMLLDIIAFKIVKLCLLTEQSNIAYKKFYIHLESVTSLTEKKGLSSEKFSYISWRAHQFERIGEMISWAGETVIPKNHSLAKVSLNGSDEYTGGSVLRLPRCGFIYLQACDLIKQLEEGDLSRDEDPYFSGDFDFYQSRLDLLDKALKDLEDTTKSSRPTGLVYSQLADLYAKNKDFKLALINYKKAAAIYRKDKWNSLFIPQLNGIIRCSKEVNSADRIAAKLELMILSDEVDDDDDDDDDDIFRENNDTQPIPVFLLGRREEIRPFSANLVFESSSCYTGIGVNTQLTISPLFKSPETIIISRLQIFAKGGGLDNDPIVIIHDESLPSSTFIIPSKIDEDGKSTTTTFKSNLAFTRNISRIFQVHFFPKQLGDVEYEKVLIDIKYPRFEFQQQIKQEEERLEPVIRWATSTASTTSDHPLFKHIRTSPSTPPHTTRVHPRPSKVIITSDAPALAASGETLVIGISIENQEDDAILLQIDGNASSDGGESLKVDWSDDNDSNDYHELTAGSKSTHSLTLKVPNTGTTNVALELFVSYYLVSDKDKTTLIKDAALVSIPVTKPFRVNFDVAPRPHTAPWDNMFIPDITTVQLDSVPTSDNSNARPTESTISHSPVIRKRWELMSSLLYLGEGTVSIVDSSLVVSSGSQDVECEIISRDPSEMPSNPSTELVHNDNVKHNFTFDCFRISTQDVRTVPAEAHLTIKWKRLNSPTIHSFLVSPVRLHLPLYEPRVILAIAPQLPPLSKVTTILNASYYIENATSHILTYSVAITSSPEFALQGPKLLSIRLLPFSRRHLSYTLIRIRNNPADNDLLPLPSLKVYDTFYKRVLPIIPASSNIRSDKSTLYVDVSSPTTP